MKAAPADPLARVRAREEAPSLHRFPSFRFLEILSFVHSGVYAGLLVFAFGPENETATLLLGWAHGLIWIAMSLLCIVAARRRTIPFWLAVVVAVIGGLGPFAGTAGFLWEQHRRRRDNPVQTS
ncbi:hypothetical protein VSS74_09485 [Conexibacter stalactiti]|uniref:DUF3817 domain-containing protein n=1 Tax=Conexibacter stalactiti TaxID=1940611 RepID=A0ABU4HMP0_9ACTN|nr:hypothetical protein [Conexibacter stalactiti]MDW5594568.1 hypothetical protein [Conexibacter stalactiti]MEC5035210.1 hypothetical protein [Conexibacter stalactiti]